MIMIGSEQGKSPCENPQDSNQSPYNHHLRKHGQAFSTLVVSEIKNIEFGKKKKKKKKERNINFKCLDEAK
jgi:hypothetical protein